MNINFNKIKEIYGEEVLKEIIDNLEQVKENIKYFVSLKFDDIDDIFEREVLLFLYAPTDFKNKLNSLIKKIGPDYVELIENDIGILDELL